MRKSRIFLVVGTRPNFVKAAAIMKESAKWDQLILSLIHTGQHYDTELSDLFFRQLEIPEPNHHLKVGSGSHGVQTARLLEKLEELITVERPDMVMVVGDVNSTLAAALVASKLVIPVAHIEAGLRSFDRAMPEEVNRLVVDVLSDLLFTTCEDGNRNLEREGVDPSKVHFVGNTMIDTLDFVLPVIRPNISSVLRRFGLREHGYGLVTLHRPSNVDHEEIFDGLVRALGSISESLPLLFSVHPRTEKLLQRTPRLASALANANITLTPPLGYESFLSLLSSARLVLTDSGGIQEETTCLGIPCLTLRENTERPITITSGTNRLVGSDPDRILAAASTALSRSMPHASRPHLWDGKSASRILPIIAKFLGND